MKIPEDREFFSASSRWTGSRIDPFSEHKNYETPKSEKLENPKNGENHYFL